MSDYLSFGLHFKLLGMLDFMLVFKSDLLL